MSYSRQELAMDLRELARGEPKEQAGLARWYEEARRVQERMASAPDVVTGVPDFIWHYLSDADVRLKDPRYARMQKDMLSELLAILEGLTSQ